MPQLIDAIDAIARRLGRDVLFVTFPACDPLQLDGEQADWEDHAPRLQVIEWLDANAFTWRPCGKFVSENMLISYCGDIYIDVPYDLDAPRYQQLAAFLETTDGAPAIEGTRFCLLPLDVAMKNRHHDEPGFWDEWVKTF